MRELLQTIALLKRQQKAGGYTLYGYDAGYQSPSFSRVMDACASRLRLLCSRGSTSTVKGLPVYLPVYSPLEMDFAVPLLRLGVEYK